EGCVCVRVRVRVCVCVCDRERGGRQETEAACSLWVLSRPGVLKLCTDRTEPSQQEAAGYALVICIQLFLSSGLPPLSLTSTTTAKHRYSLLSVCLSVCL